MEKGKNIQIIIIITCAILVIGFCGFLIYRHNTKVEELTDAIKFKEEYESLNGTNTNDKEYPKVEISEDNPIIYKSPKEIINVLNNENAVVYFGFSTCPWCRNVIETLLQAASENGLDKIYYVDIKDIRDTYEYDGSLNPKQTKKGTDAYYEILDFLGDNLDKYYVTDSEGNKYDTGVTRLYAPTVISVSKGEVKDIHVSTVDSHKDPFIKMNDEQQKELLNIFNKLIKSVNNNTCLTDEAC